MRIVAFALLFGVAFLLTFAPAEAQRDLSGAAEIELQLEKLNVLGSVLMIAAHPDEDGPLPQDALFPQDAEIGWKPSSARVGS